MNRPIDLFELFVWVVRALLIGLLVMLIFACSMNYATLSTNPTCIVNCTATPPSAAASGINVTQSIRQREEGAIDLKLDPKEQP